MYKNMNTNTSKKGNGKAAKITILVILGVIIVAYIIIIVESILNKKWILSEYKRPEQKDQVPITVAPRKLTTAEKTKYQSVLKSLKSS